MPTMKPLFALLALAGLGCSVAIDEPVGSEQLALPVTASAPCILVTCDAATCPGALTVTQTVPANTGHVEVWDATQWAGGTGFNLLPNTTITQSAGSVVTRTTGFSNFKRNDTFCLLTSVVIRAANGNIDGTQSMPVVPNGAGGFRLALQPSAVTATVAP